MVCNDDKPSPRVTRSGAKSALSLSRAIDELKRKGQLVTYTTQPKLGLRDALRDE